MKGCYSMLTAAFFRCPKSARFTPKTCPAPEVPVMEPCSGRIVVQTELLDVVTSPFTLSRSEHVSPMATH
jgi:hypothetical protein